MLALERHRGHGVQRIEQKVRIELTAQRCETRLRETLLKPRSRELAGLRFVIEAQRVRCADDATVDEHVEDEVRGDELVQQQWERRVRSVPRGVEHGGAAEVGES